MGERRLFRRFQAKTHTTGVNTVQPDMPLHGLVWWARFSEPRQRLWAEIKISEAKLRSVVVTVTDVESKKICNKPGLNERNDLLAAADFAQRRGCKDASWALILSERRLAAAVFNDKQRANIACSLRDQARGAEMIKSWRGEAVLHLLP